jgi:hypothetical protein
MSIDKLELQRVRSLAAIHRKRKTLIGTGLELSRLSLDAGPVDFGTTWAAMELMDCLELGLLFRVGTRCGFVSPDIVDPSILSYNGISFQWVRQQIQEAPNLGLWYIGLLPQAVRRAVPSTLFGS